MPKYNNLSVLRRIDQHDLKSTRKVMFGLNHALDRKNQENLDAMEGQKMALTATERYVRLINSLKLKLNLSYSTHFKPHHPSTPDVSSIDTIQSGSVAPLPEAC